MFRMFVHQQYQFWGMSQNKGPKISFGIVEMADFSGNPWIFGVPNSESYTKRILILPWHTFCILNYWRCDAIDENHPLRRNGFSMENYPKMALIFEWNWWYHLQICMSSRNVIIPCIQPEFQALFLSLSLSLSLPFIITILAAPKRITPITPERVQQSRLIGLVQGQCYLATCYLLSNSTLSGWVSFKGLILRRGRPEV